MASNLPPGCTNADIERQCEPFTGEDLYTMWQAHLTRQDVSTDDWHALETTDKNALAKELV